jgi:hypothetical protein
VISDHILEHLHKRKIIISKQFGFLKRRSVESQLPLAVENWKIHTDKGAGLPLLGRLPYFREKSFFLGTLILNLGTKGNLRESKDF